MLLEFAAMVRGERNYEVDLETESRVHRYLLTACGIPCEYKTKIECEIYTKRIEICGGTH